MCKLPAPGAGTSVLNYFCEKKKSMWGLWHVNSSLQLRSFQAVRLSGENELQQQKVWGIVRAHRLPGAGLASRPCLVKRLPPLVVCKLFASC